MKVVTMEDFVFVELEQGTVNLCCKNLKFRFSREEALNLAHKLIEIVEEIKNYSSLQEGDTLWYVNTEENILEEARIHFIHFKENNEVDCLGLDFIEPVDYDEFDGCYLGGCLFVDKTLAEEHFRNECNKK